MKNVISIRAKVTLHGTYVCLCHQSVKRVADPLEVHLRARVGIGRYFDVAVAPSLVIHDTSILGGIWCPSGTSKELDGMHGGLVLQWQVVDRDDNCPFGSGSMVLALVVY